MTNADVELWFLDASAFVKLITAEPESEELKLWMRGRTRFQAAGTRGYGS